MQNLENTGNLSSYDKAPQRIGLYTSEADMIADESKVIDSQTGLPVLVSADSLDIYNQAVVSELAGEGRALVFTHLVGSRSAANAVIEEVNSGNTVLINTDDSEYDRTQEIEEQIKDIDPSIEIEDIPEVVQDQYLGYVRFNKFSRFKLAPDFVSTYRQSPELHVRDDDKSYAALVDVLSDEKEVDAAWNLYSSQFKNVEKISITEAAFDEATFRSFMKDPSVIKAIRYVENEISSIMMFLTDMSKASWLNEDFFAAKYPEAYSTDNILLFLGVASDPNSPGVHSFSPMRLLVSTGEVRGSDVLITFECNEVSTRYLPKIVRMGIGSSKIANVDGLDEPISRSRFKIIRKKR